MGVYHCSAIDEWIETLQKFKELGATHVGVEWEGYIDNVCALNIVSIHADGEVNDNGKYKVVSIK